MKFQSLVNRRVWVYFLKVYGIYIASLHNFKKNVGLLFQ